MKHICASCLLKDNKQLPHAESDPSLECPHHELWLYGKEQINTNCSDHDCNICAGSSSLQSNFGVQKIWQFNTHAWPVAESKIPNAFGCKILIYSKLYVTFFSKNVIKLSRFRSG